MRAARLLGRSSSSKQPVSNKTLAGVAGVVVGGSTAYYFWHREPVPLSGRMRFINMSRDTEARLGKVAFEAFVHDNQKLILPATHPSVAAVRRVLKRLTDKSGFPELKKLDWKVIVVNNPTQNAMVLPGGYVIVFTGIIDVAQNLDGLATVLSHEAAHVLCRHAAERVSRSQVFVPFLMLAAYFFQIPYFYLNTMSQLLMELPNSRTHESEADLVGLHLMARSCFDPREAVSFWKRMSEAGGTQPPELLSTHPANETRIKQIKKMMPDLLRESAQHCPRNVSNFV